MTDSVQDLLAAYQQTLVRIELSGGELEVTTAGLGTTQGPRPFDHTVYVITAWNPGSAETPDEVNRAAHQELVDWLAEQGHEYWPSVGTAPDGTWREEGVAVVGLGRLTALEVGRRFGQLAVFEWDGVGFRIVFCADGVVVNGGWTSRWV